MGTPIRLRLPFSTITRGPVKPFGGFSGAHLHEGSGLMGPPPNRISTDFGPWGARRKRLQDSYRTQHRTKGRSNTQVSQDGTFIVFCDHQPSSDPPVANAGLTSDCLQPNGVLLWRGFDIPAPHVGRENHVEAQTPLRGL